MSAYFDAVVFIDRREAKLFHFSAKGEVKLVLAHTSAQRPHHQANHEDRTKHAPDDEFMETIVRSLDHDGNTLICGPGNSKYELQAYVQKHSPDLAARISGVEDLDDPLDSGILAAAQKFFGTREHRHGMQHMPSAGHFDVPGKS